MDGQYTLGRLINRGGWANGDVYEAMNGEGRAVVLKTYRGRRTWIGRILIRREKRAYARLQGMPGIAEMMPSEAEDTLAMARVDAQAIVYAVDADNCQIVRDRLLQVADAMHARRVYHLDLRNRGNILVDDQGNPYIVDFASAALFKGTGWGTRLVEKLCLAFDRYGLSKWLNYCDSFLPAGHETK